MAENKGIMNCSLEELKDTCSRYITRFDDFQQLSSNQDRPELITQFVEAYDFVERFYLNLKSNINISAEDRNNLRLVIKETEKLGSDLQLDPKVFDLDFQWQFYLVKMGLKEEEMHPVQKQETKRAFMGACGQMFSLLYENMANCPDEEGEEYFRKMINQVSDFFKKETIKHNQRN